MDEEGRASGGMDYRDNFSDGMWWWCAVPPSVVVLRLRCGAAVLLSSVQQRAGDRATQGLACLMVYAVCWCVALWWWWWWAGGGGGGGRADDEDTSALPEETEVKTEGAPIEDDTEDVAEIEKGADAELQKQQKISASAKV